jgi:EAL domain-containing protein (putative c-di-GMP-specific phosphodiesterase class I)
MGQSRTPPPFGKPRDTQRFRVPDLKGRPAVGRSAAGATGLWVLESRTREIGGVQRTPLRPLPFRIGRAAGLALVLPSAHVSKHHAEIYSDGLALRIRDLGSRNGTFVNRQAVTDGALHEQDVLHIGGHEFRVVRVMPDQDASDTAPLGDHVLSGAVRVVELIRQRAVSVLFQPIVSLPSTQVEAYEALGRGAYAGLPESPVELFDLAGALGPDVQAELSRLFRQRAVELARDHKAPLLIFLNTHPADLETPGLLESLQELRSAAPQLKLVLEIHESALAQPDIMSWLHGRLGEIGVGLAYDDFGAGQARLFELAEAPPEYLKFDRRFVTGIDSAPASRKQLVRSLVAAVRELNAKPVAEGVETAQEAEACLGAGFMLAQGHHYGMPKAIGDI